MAQIVSETGGWIRAWHHGGGYSPYPTGTVTVRASGTLKVHTQLSRVAAERAEIGIIEATPQFGPPQPQDWEPFLYGDMINFTIGAWAHHGEMTGWWFVQEWN